MSALNARREAGLVLEQSWTVTIDKYFGLQSVGLLKKIKSFLCLLKNRTNNIKAQC